MVILNFMNIRLSRSLILWSVWLRRYDVIIYLIKHQKQEKFEDTKDTKDTKGVIVSCKSKKDRHNTIYYNSNTLFQ